MGGGRRASARRYGFRTWLGEDDDIHGAGRFGSDGEEEEEEADFVVTVDSDDDEDEDDDEDDEGMIG